MVNEDDFTWKEVGERVRNRRVALHVSQDALAEVAGLTQNGIFKVEAGETNPQLSTLQGIARALKCSVRDLVVGMPTGDSALRAQVHRVQRIMESGDEVAIRVMETGFENAEAFLDRGLPRGRRGLPPIRIKGDGRRSQSNELLWKRSSVRERSEADDQPAIEANLRGGRTFRDDIGNTETTHEKKR